jgi:3-oxoacyl-[acyl-carrier protein] reductase
MDLGLNGSRALVGGGSRGLGAAIAAVLASEGARVAVTARSADRLSEHASAINAVPIVADLSTEGGPLAAVTGAVEQLGGLDLLVVNTGGPPPGTFADVTEEQWRTAIDGTMLSTLRLIRHALPALRAGRAPSILIVLSSSVREPIPGLVTSNVLRPGLTGLIKTLVGEVAPVRINGIAPGRVATDRVAANDLLRARSAGTSVEEVQRLAMARIPVGRYGDPDEVGRVAAFLLSPAASYVDGAILSIDGGMSRSLP